MLSVRLWATCSTSDAMISHSVSHVFQSKYFVRGWCATWSVWLPFLKAPALVRQALPSCSSWPDKTGSILQPISPFICFSRLCVCWPRANGLLCVSADECGFSPAGGMGATRPRPWRDIWRLNYLQLLHVCFCCHQGLHVSLMMLVYQHLPLFNGCLRKKKEERIGNVLPHQSSVRDWGKEIKIGA